MSLFRNRDDKKIKLYALYRKDDPKTFLTVTVHKEDALEYALALLRLQSDSHYNAWCQLRNYDPAQEQSWFQYFDNCITQEEKEQFVVSQITYKLKDLVAIVRMFADSMPLGCSFNTPIEYAYAESQSAIDGAGDALIDCDFDEESTDAE